MLVEVKGYFRPEKGRSQEEKVIVPQGFPIFGFFDRGWSENHSPIRGAVNCATPGYSLVNPAGAFYQGSHISKLRFTRIIRYEKGKRIQNPAKHGAESTCAGEGRMKYPLSLRRIPKLQKQELHSLLWLLRKNQQGIPAYQHHMNV